MKKTIILGLGNKARQGKDLIAEYWQKTRKNIYVIHFADALYDELKNPDFMPIIYRDESKYFLTEGIGYTEKTIEEVPKLHEIFESRNIEQYDCMVEKDPEMLQFWGTDFKRAGNENCWVEKVFSKINSIEETSQDGIQIFVIPDLRFKNEFEAIKNLEGYCINVKRVDDGIQFIDESRSHNHQSEVDLDDVEFDYVIEASSGDFNELYNQAELLLSLIINQNRK